LLNLKATLPSNLYVCGVGFKQTMIRFIKILIFCFVFQSGIAQQEIALNNETCWRVMTSA
jgi:hypothetical protein